MPMTRWNYQLDLAKRWAEHRESNVILKRRQVGASVLLRAYCLWRAWSSGWEIGYWSKGEREADLWLDGVEQMARDLPAELGLVAHRSGRDLRVGTGTIHVFPGSQTAGISYTLQLVVADEAAHHAYGAENYANYGPSVGAGGQFIALSTADPKAGPAGWFYDMWTEAQAGRSPYLPVFVDRWARPDQQQEWWAIESARYPDSRTRNANYPEHPEQAFEGAEGLVYGVEPDTGILIFDPKRNIKPPPCPWYECKFRLGVVDPGGRDPTAAIRGGVTPNDRLHVYALYYRRGAAAASALRVADFLTREGPLHRTWSDGTGWPGTLTSMGIPTFAPNKDKGLRLAETAAMLKSGRLTFSPELEPIFKEFATYWHPTRKHLEAGGSAYDTRTPDWHHGDAMDVVGYFVLGYLRMQPRGDEGGMVPWRAT